MSPTPVPIFVKQQIMFFTLWSLEPQSHNVANILYVFNSPHQYFSWPHQAKDIFIKDLAHSRKKNMDQINVLSKNKIKGHNGTMIVRG